MFWYIIGAILVAISVYEMQPQAGDPGYTMNCGQQVYY